MVCENVTLEDILDDIFYLTSHTNLTGEYIENMTIFEREFYVYSMIKKITKQNEENANG